MTKTLKQKLAMFLVSSQIALLQVHNYVDASYMSPVSIDSELFNHLGKCKVTHK